MLLIDIHFVSSVSARKLKCPSSTRLGSEPFQLGSVQLGKFQLELITKSFPSKILWDQPQGSVVPNSWIWLASTSLKNIWQTVNGSSIVHRCNGQRKAVTLIWRGYIPIFFAVFSTGKGSLTHCVAQTIKPTERKISRENVASLWRKQLSLLVNKRN